MNKQKIDWVERPQWKCDLAIIMGKLVGHRNADFDTPVEDFISQLLKTQREEIISEIEGIVGEDEKYDVGFYSTGCAETLIIQIRNQLRKQIRERLKQI